MDGASAKKSTSFETLVIRNITNISELKDKINEIISTGKNYEYDVSSCLKTLLNGSDQAIVLLCVQAISELAKCEIKRETYAQKDFVKPLLNILSKEVTVDTVELAKQCCRALGNLCCDCDVSRNIILESNGSSVLLKVLNKTLADGTLAEIRLLTSKALLNYAIGGPQFSESIVNEGVIEMQYKILLRESLKEDMNDEEVTTALLILSVINDNASEFQFEAQINKVVLDVLRETSNIEVSELCLEHLHSQAEHDDVKSLLANEGGIQLVCERLEQLMAKHEAGDVDAADAEVEAVIKQACDLIIIVLTGDEAMHTLYNNGHGEVYLKMVQWLDSGDYNLLATAVLAIGNFARNDIYCIQMMENNIYDKLLDIFEVYHGLSTRAAVAGSEAGPVAHATLDRIQHGALAALRNLAVPAHNKRAAAARGRAAPLLLRALPAVQDHHVAYKLLAALRMLLDGQESAARQLVQAGAALRAAARWAGAGHAGAAGEAPRLLARAVRQLHADAAPALLQAEGCAASLVGMLVTSHAVMQNEAILALTLLAMEVLHRQPQGEGHPLHRELVRQLLAAELGEHLYVLVDTNRAKMPVEVAENLVAFLEISCREARLAAACGAAGVPRALRTFADARQDFSDELRRSIDLVIASVSAADHAAD